MRHRWTVEALAAAPSDTILEIGCGHGIATGLVCDRLESGHLTAIDRSVKMAEACGRRNAAAIQAGRLTVLAGDFEAHDFAERFDGAFAVNVDFPRHRDQGWAQKLSAALRPGGTVMLVLEAPAPATAERFGHTAAAALAAQAFAVEIVPGPGLVGVRALRS